MFNFERPRPFDLRSNGPHRRTFNRRPVFWFQCGETIAPAWLPDWRPRRVVWPRRVW